MVSRGRKPGNRIFRGHSAGGGAAVPGTTAPGYRRARGSRCGRAVGVAGRETGFCHSGTAHTETYDVDAAFMLLERNAACLFGPLPDVLKPDIQCVRTHWNRDFMAFQLARSTRIVVLIVPTWPESGFREGVARLRGRGLARAGADGQRRVVDGVSVVVSADGAGRGWQGRRSARGESNGRLGEGNGAPGRAATRAGWADEGEGRVDGDGRGREFGINGGSSGKDGVITMGDHRWYSWSYVG